MPGPVVHSRENSRQPGFGRTETSANGNSVDPTEYYFRTTADFETASEKYAWMNNIVSVAVGERLAAGVKYRVFEIL